MQNKRNGGLLHISFETASLWFDVANVALVIALVLGVLATFSIYWMGNIKEEYLHERTVKLENDTAKANERAAASELKLEELRRQVGPRQLNRPAFLEALKVDVKGQVEILYTQDDAEAMELAQQIGLALKESGWKVLKRDPIPRSRGNLPTAMAVGGQPKGVTVAAHSISDEEADATLKKMKRENWVKTPYTVLLDAIAEGLGTVSGSAGGAHAPPVGTLRIVVAPRI